MLLCVVGWSLFVVDCCVLMLLFDVCCRLFVICSYSLISVCRLLLFGVCCLALLVRTVVIRCVLFAGCCLLLFVVGCLLFVLCV